MSQLHGLMVCLLVLACTSKNAGEKEYAQSALIHNAMVSRATEMEYHIHKLLAENSSGALKDSLQTILIELQNWKEQLVEVPGNDRHDHAGHNHDIHAWANVTPQQMLLIQQSLDSTLTSINKRLHQLNKNE